MLDKIKRYIGKKLILYVLANHVKVGMTKHLFAIPTSEYEQPIKKLEKQDFIDYLYDFKAFDERCKLQHLDDYEAIKYFEKEFDNDIFSYPETLNFIYNKYNVYVTDNMERYIIATKNDIIIFYGSLVGTISDKVYGLGTMIFDVSASIYFLIAMELYLTNRDMLDIFLNESYTKVINVILKTPWEMNTNLR